MKHSKTPLPEFTKIGTATVAEIKDGYVYLKDNDTDDELGFSAKEWQRQFSGPQIGQSVDIITAGWSEHFKQNWWGFVPTDWTPAKDRKEQSVAG